MRQPQRTRRWTRRTRRDSDARRIKKWSKSAGRAMRRPHATIKFNFLGAGLEREPGCAAIAASVRRTNGSFPPHQSHEATTENERCEGARNNQPSFWRLEKRRSQERRSREATIARATIARVDREERRRKRRSRGATTTNDAARAGRTVVSTDDGGD